MIIMFLRLCSKKIQKKLSCLFDAFPDSVLVLSCLVLFCLFICPFILSFFHFPFVFLSFSFHFPFDFPFPFPFFPLIFPFHFPSLHTFPFSLLCYYYFAIIIRCYSFYIKLCVYHLHSPFSAHCVLMFFSSVILSIFIFPFGLHFFTFCSAKLNCVNNDLH